MSNNPETSPVNVTERMAARAAEFVDACKTAGVALDYLPRTLPMAEKFVRSTPAETAIASTVAPAAPIAG